MNDTNIEVDAKEEIADRITAILDATDYSARTWTGGYQVRVYVSRRLSRKVQDMGYIEIMDDGGRNYGTLSRASATVRDSVEAGL